MINKIREWLGLLPSGYVILENKSNGTHIACCPKGLSLPHPNYDVLFQICWDHYKRNKK